MKESTKGVLLSGLVYPGLGQFVLEAKFSGVLFAILTTAGLLVIFYRLTVRIYHALDPILSLLANNTLNWNRFIAILSHSSYDSWQIEGISLVLFLDCWVLASLHAFFVGQKIDRETG